MKSPRDDGMKGATTMEHLPCLDNRPPDDDVVLDHCGPYTVFQGSYGPYLLDAQDNLPCDVDVFRAGIRNKGLRLHCKHLLQCGQLYMVDEAGESWCLPCFEQALPRDDDREDEDEDKDE
jgi:hypothetical protein